MHYQEFIRYIILAIVQGISEVLPISSSGHLQVLQYLFNMDISDLSLSIFLHIGSFIAVIIFYWRVLKSIFKDFFTYIFKKDKRPQCQDNFRLVLMLGISSIPAGIAGFLLKKHIENIFQDIFFIGISLIITSMFLYISNSMKQKKNISQITYLDAFIIGLFQAIGIIPGISRSGVTLTGAKQVKLKNEDATKYAFLMFIPIAIGSLISELIDFKSGEFIFDSSLKIPYIVGIIISALFTYLSLQFLLNLIKKGKLWYFSVYCLFAGIFIIALSFIR